MLVDRFLTFREEFEFKFLDFCGQPAYFFNVFPPPQVAKGGAAQSCGELAVGMRIVEVNGISLLGASHSQAVKALKSSQELHITVCDGFDVQEVLKRKSLADTLDDDTFSSVTVGSHGK